MAVAVQARILRRAHPGHPHGADALIRQQFGDDDRQIQPRLARSTWNDPGFGPRKGIQDRRVDLVPGAGNAGPDKGARRRHSGRSPKGSHGFADHARRDAAPAAMRHHDVPRTDQDQPWAIGPENHCAGDVRIQHQPVDAAMPTGTSLTEATAVDLFGHRHGFGHAQRRQPAAALVRIALIAIGSGTKGRLHAAS